MKESPYFNQAKFLLQILPFISTEDCFALKGGTAINFFCRNLLRLSVDIDLAYLPIKSWNDTLWEIDTSLKRIKKSIKKQIPSVRITEKKNLKPETITKLFIRSPEGIVKIEPNIVFRGFVYSSEVRELSKSAQDIFELFVEINTLSTPDLYGSKLCAALDRQHPRDLFDLKILLENEGITDEIRKAFIIYLSGHNRPINELLNPNPADIKQTYESSFVGMTTQAVELHELIKVQKYLISTIRKKLTRKERKFLLSIKSGKPDWDLMELPGIENLPAIQWKLANIARMDEEKHRVMLEKLKVLLK